MKKILAVIFLTIFMLSGTCLAAKHQGTTGGTEKMSNTNNPIAVMETNVGTVEIELYLDKTPITVQNFIDLAQKGFYDKTIFHRVIDGFMIQGGDPEGTGMGGPGYTIPDEFLPDLKFTGEGILAMANTGMPHTGGSQFFITLAKTPWLNGKHTIFGRVISGMDVVRSIGHEETDFQDKPLKTIRIQKLTIKNMPEQAASANTAAQDVK